MAKKLNNPRWMKVIEEYVWAKNIPLTKLAERVDIPYDTVVRWFRNVDFLKALEKRYYESQTVEYIECVKAMVEEAKNGSAIAFREIKPIFEKNQTKIEGMIAPYSEFTQNIQINNINPEKEVQDPLVDVQNKVHEEVHTEVHKIPRQTVSVQEQKERVEVIKKTYKKQKVNKTKRNALMKLKRRAKKVGLASLGHGRPSKTERANWLKKLERLEKKAGITPPSP
jgi:hypothetical protein